MKRTFLVLAILAAALCSRAQSTGVISITVTNTAANIVVDRPCNRVVVRENSATPTAIFSITLSGTTTALNYPAGTQFAIVNPQGSNWPTGAVIALIVATTAGPFTFTGTETIGQGSQTVNNSASSSGGSGDLTAEYIIGATDSNLTNASVNPHFYTSPDAMPSSPTTYDDEFPGSSLNARWTVFDSTTKMTKTVAANQLVLASTDTSGVGAGIYEAAPSPTWEFTAKIIFTGIPSAYNLGGIAAFESSTGKLAYCGFYNDGTASTNMKWVVDHGTKGGAINSIISTQYQANTPGYFKIRYDGTSMFYSMSVDGQTFWQIYTEAKTAAFTTAPDQIGIVIGPFANTFKMTVVWFRRTA